MTNITITKESITVQGHSSYATLGNDIICSAISTMCNYMQELDQLPYEAHDGYYKFDITNISDYNLRVFKDLIGQLSNQYKDFVSVEVRG